MLDVPRLTLLAAVIESGSMTAAAQALNYTPSAVSQQIRRLEKEVGQPLLQRGPRGVKPTEAGAVLAAHARRISRQLNAAQADIDELAGLRRGRLEIGTFPTVGGSLLPRAISMFRRRHPHVRLAVHSARLDGLLAIIADGTVDLALLWDYEWNRLDPAEVELTHLLEDPTTLLVAADHHVARRRKVEMSELADEDWIEREHDHPVVEVLDRSCRAAGYQPRITFRANDYQEAQAMVSVGLGIALAPLTAVINKHPDIRVISLGATAPPRRILIGRRHDRVHAPAEAAMVAVLHQVAQQHLDATGRHNYRTPR